MATKLRSDRQLVTRFDTFIRDAEDDEKQVLYNLLSLLNDRRDIVADLMAEADFLASDQLKKKLNDRKAKKAK